MDKYINANLIIADLEDKIEEAWMDHDYYRGYNDGLELAINALQEAPPADKGYPRCPVCGEQSKYCPNCGAKMEGVSE